MKDLNYSELKLQEYLKLKNLNVEEAKLLFKFRTHQADFSENFRGGRDPANCKLCNTHLDNQPLSFQCPVVKSSVIVRGKYEDIFEDVITKELAKTLKHITSLRD